MHLHGSLSYNKIQSTYFATQSGHSCIVRDGLIVGRRKLDKILQEPYYTYYGALTDALIDYPNVLVVGYGFNDVHVNAFLSRMESLQGNQKKLYCIDILQNDALPHWMYKAVGGTDLCQTQYMLCGTDREQSWKNALDWRSRRGEKFIQYGDKFLLDSGGFLSDEQQMERILTFLG